MSQLAAAANPSRHVTPQSSETFVIFMVGEQAFGIPVIRVQDILTLDVVAAVPLSSPDISGSINLRGRIVTVVDVRTRLAMPPGADRQGRRMGVTVESDNEFYTLLVDSVGEVISLSSDQFEANPSTLDPLWREIAQGVYRLDSGLLIALDVERLLDIRARV